MGDENYKKFESHYDKDHGNWVALAPAPEMHLTSRYDQLAVLDISNGCQVSRMTLATLSKSADGFPYGHIVANWSDNRTHQAMCLSFAPTMSGPDKARQELTSVAVSYKHVVDNPIGFAVVSGGGYAKILRKEFGLPKNFRGTVIAERQKGGAVYE